MPEKQTVMLVGKNPLQTVTPRAWVSVHTTARSFMNGSVNEPSGGETWVLSPCLCGACRAEPPFGTSMAGGCEWQQSAERPPPAFLSWAGRKWVIFKAGAQVWNRSSCFFTCKKRR